MVQGVWFWLHLYHRPNPPLKERHHLISPPKVWSQVKNISYICFELHFDLKRTGRTLSNSSFYLWQMGSDNIVVINSLIRRCRKGTIWRVPGKYGMCSQLIVRTHLRLTTKYSDKIDLWNGEMTRWSSFHFGYMMCFSRRLQMGRSSRRKRSVWFSYRTRWSGLYTIEGWSLFPVVDRWFVLPSETDGHVLPL